MNIIPLLAGASLLLFVAWLLFKRRYVFFSFLFTIFTFVWKLIAAINIDLTGPLYAEQLYREIGPSNSALFLVSSHFCILLPFLFVFRRRRLAGIAALFKDRDFQRNAIDGSKRVAFLVAASYVALLYFDLFKIGIIPLFEGLERFEYTETAGGIFHGFLIKYGNIFCFHLGVFYFFPKLFRRPGDNRFLYLLVAILLYSFLAGNRFSAFYSFGTFFLIPYGAVFILHGSGGRVGGSGKEFVRLLTRSWKAKIVTGLACLFIGYGLYNNLTRVRGYDSEEATEKFLHRSFVQPAEIWWLTYERVFLEREYDPGQAFHFLFVDPLDPTRNTTIQYLMVRANGEQLATYHASVKHIYAGGFPEIFFELFDVYFGFIALLGAGWLTAELLFQVLKAFILGRYMSVFWVIYVLYALLNLYIGGMLNFLTAWTFWVKVSIMVFSLVFDGKMLSRNPFVDVGRGVGGPGRGTLPVGIVENPR